MRIIDISPLVSEASPVYPGDAPLTLEFSLSPQVRVSTLKMSAHLGAHVDAPLHLNRSGDVTDIDLSTMIGPCQVVEVPKTGGIEVKDLGRIHCPRVLIKTGFKPSTKWTDTFAYLTEKATAHLIEQGVRLIGIDTPSIDWANDQKLQSHVLSIDANVLILENLDLNQTQAGDYELIALPLKIQGLEASPVRAVLINNKESKGG